MEANLEDLINLYVFTPGRRLFALEQLRRILAERGDEAGLLARLDTAITAEKDHLTLVARYTQARDGRPEERSTQQIDYAVDRALSALDQTMAAHLEVLEPADALAGKVRALRRDLFPAGVGAITTLAYPEELAQLDRVLGLATGDHQATVADLGATRIVTKLGELAGRFRAALQDTPSEPVSYGQVKASAAACQNRLLQITAVVLGQHPEPTAADAEARAALLGPILVQQQAIGAHRRARRAVPDVDPQTGVEVTTPVPTPPPAPATPATPPTDA